MANNLEDFRITLNEQLEAIHTTIDEFFPVNYTHPVKTPTDVAEEIAEGREEDLIAANKAIADMRGKMKDMREDNFRQAIRLARLNTRILELEDDKKKIAKNFDEVARGKLNLIRFLLDIGFDNDTIDSLIDGAPYTTKKTIEDDKITATTTITGEVQFIKPNKTY